MEATELDLVNAVVSRWWRESLVVIPHFRPLGWWECDVWQVTKPRLATEYEVKTSLADFRADSRKCNTRRERYEWDNGNWGWRDVPHEYKHDLLSKGCSRGPSRFYYVVGESLASQVEPELPSWAGLLVVPWSSWRGGFGKPLVVKGAPRLHTTKVDTRVVEQARQALPWRFLKAHSDLAEYQLACRLREPANSRSMWRISSAVPG